jgi:hypothetical protein
MTTAHSSRTWWLAMLLAACPAAHGFVFQYHGTLAENRGIACHSPARHPFGAVLLISGKRFEYSPRGYGRTLGTVVTRDSSDPHLTHWEFKPDVAGPGGAAERAMLPGIGTFNEKSRELAFSSRGCKIVWRQCAESRGRKPTCG